MNKFTNVYSEKQLPDAGMESRNVLADYAQAGIDHDAVRAGIDLFDRAKPHLVDRPERWGYFRQDMLNLGFPSDWLPESFRSAEELNQFIDHANDINGRMKITLAGYPVRKKKELPTRPSTSGAYDPLAEFNGLVKQAYKLGIAPPASADPEDILRFKAQVSPWLEQEKIRSYKPGTDGKGWGGTWKI